MSSSISGKLTAKPVRPSHSLRVTPRKIKALPPRVTPWDVASMLRKPRSRDTVSLIPSSSRSVTINRYSAGSSALHGSTSSPRASNTSSGDPKADHSSACSDSFTKVACTSTPPVVSTRSVRAPVRPSWDATGTRSTM